MKVVLTPNLFWLLIGTCWYCES